MAFTIKNLRPTFLEVKLASRSVVLHSHEEAGPFDDSDRSPELAMLLRRNDIWLTDIPAAPETSGAGPKPAKPAKEVHE